MFSEGPGRGRLPKLETAGYHDLGSGAQITCPDLSSLFLRHLQYNACSTDVPGDLLFPEQDVKCLNLAHTEKRLNVNFFRKSSKKTLPEGCVPNNHTGRNNI